MMNENERFSQRRENSTYLTFRHFYPFLQFFPSIRKKLYRISIAKSIVRTIIIIIIVVGKGRATSWSIVKKVSRFHVHLTFRNFPLRFAKNIEFQWAKAGKLIFPRPGWRLIVRAIMVIISRREGDIAKDTGW